MKNRTRVDLWNEYTRLMRKRNAMHVKLTTALDVRIAAHVRQYLTTHSYLAVLISGSPFGLTPIAPILENFLREAQRGALVKEVDRRWPIPRRFARLAGVHRG